MESRVISVLVFSLLFGTMFVIAGIKRIFSGGPDGPNLDSIFWGSVGILLGCGMFCWLGWMLMSSKPDHDEPILLPTANSFIVSTTQK